MWGDYILAGHASPGNMQITYDVGGMTGINNARWQRIWFLDITNTGTALSNTIEFDMSDGGVGAVPIATASNYVLLYRAGQTGNWTELTTATSIVGDRVVFSGVTLNNDGYYTIGTRNHLVSPLPVELVHFEAVNNGKAVDIHWTTVSEKDNAYFTLEKSPDGLSFEALTVREGTGNSNTTTHYHEQDLSPYEGLSYYRLKQNDHSGHSSYSTIVSVDRDQSQEDGLVVFPNPSGGELSLSLSGYEKQSVRITITDLAGRVCLSKTVLIQQHTETIDLTAGEKLAPGTYLLSADSGSKRYSRKISVK